VSATGGWPSRRTWPTGPWLQEYEAFDRHYRPVVSEYLRNSYGNVAYLDEAVQDAMKIVAERWGKIRDYEQPKAYLFKIAKQRWLKHHGYRGNSGVALPEDLDGGLATSAVDHDDDCAPQIAGFRDALAALRQLPRRQREVAFLLYVADFDEDAIAQTLGIAVGSVKRHRARALHKLRQGNFAHATTRDAHTPEGGSHER
jgi:RNA polymerase sigma factor (sigma-70 family)